MLTSPPTHTKELREFGIFLLLFGALAAETFLVPQTASLRPWVEGERLPLVGALVEQEPAISEPVEETETVQGFPDRPPTLVSLLEDSDHLNGFFSGLRDLELGQRAEPVRVLHFGDSTIAADGIPGVVRERLQKRFGRRGPGFIPGRVDTRWVFRPGLVRQFTGDWEHWNLTQGGAPSRRYGLAGMPARIESAGTLRLGFKTPSGEFELQHDFSLAVQLQPEGGTLRWGPVGGAKQVFSTQYRRVKDHDLFLQVPEGAGQIEIEALGDGPVGLYGLSLEKNQPGITWETLGVAGSSIGSMRRQDVSHLKRAVAARTPSLIVYQTGGNALGYDSFLLGDGHLYKGGYLNILGRLRAGAPDADCLVVGPLDQGLRQRGQILSKPEISRMISVQRLAAAEAGCAFWDARAVMGGDGGFARWMDHEPALTWTDLMHLSQAGSVLMGERLTDAILIAFAAWEGAVSPVAIESKP